MTKMANTSETSSRRRLSQGGKEHAVLPDADNTPPSKTALVSYFSLFRYADKVDWLLMSLGFVGACGEPLRSWLRGSCRCGQQAGCGAEEHTAAADTRSPTGNGAAMPVFSILFGNLLNSFGLNLGNSSELQSQVTQYSIYFIYLGIGEQEGRRRCTAARRAAGRFAAPTGAAVGNPPTTHPAPLSCPLPQAPPWGPTCRWPAGR